MFLIVYGDAISISININIIHYIVFYRLSIYIRSLPIVQLEQHANFGVMSVGTSCIFLRRLVFVSKYNMP